MKVYNYINYNHTDKATEFKRKRSLCDKVYKYANSKNHDYYPITEKSGFIIHLGLDNKAGNKFIVVAESKDILPACSEEYTFVSTADYLNGKF